MAWACVLKLLCILRIPKQPYLHSTLKRKGKTDKSFKSKLIKDTKVKRYLDVEKNNNNNSLSPRPRFADFFLFLIIISVTVAFNKVITSIKYT